MAEPIKCPACGEMNPAGQEFCQNCQTRLKPSTGTTKSTDSLIRPGQAPTKKNTADLEPILPQWLKDARDSARNSDQQDAPQFSQKPEQKQSAASSEDLLAGLRSQADNDEEDDTPDWLTSITGEASKPKKASTESTEARRVELGSMSDFAQEESVSSDSETPSWLAGLTPSESQADEKDELTDWFRNADDSKPMETPKEISSFDDTFSTTSSKDETPDWLRQMSADEDAKKAQPQSFDTDSNLFPAESSDTPDWLKQMAGGDNQPPSFDEPASAIPANDADTPDWLRKMEAVDNLTPPPASADANKDVPDWLHGIEDRSQSTDLPDFTESGSGKSEPPALVSTGELPAWLNDPVEKAPKARPG